MNIQKLFTYVLPLFRKGRMLRFLTSFSFDPPPKILDVGGTPFNWKLVRYPHPVVLLNEEYPEGMLDEPNFTRHYGDARNMDFGDNAFDIAYSNSVIEHVGSWEDQKTFADEIRRIAPNLWVQTPARSFFFEPHYLTPFFHWFPIGWQRVLARNFTIWGLLERPSRGQVEERLNEIRLLSFSEMQELFPDCHILCERFLGMPKCYIAVRQRGRGVPAFSTTA